MSDDLHAALPNDDRWLETAGRILANLGFELQEPDRTSADATSHLLVALRPRPTQQHFDAESIDYWVTEGDRGRAAGLDLEGRFPVDAGYAWGRIVLTDRLNVKNEFLSFGGRLRAEIGADGVALVDFGSDAPILRWSGHSQDADPLAAEVGAYFARIKVPIDFLPGAEALVAMAAPKTLYCAFIQHVRDHLAKARTLREANEGLAAWASHESGRMQAEAVDEWAAAAVLRRQLRATEAGARK